MVKGIRAVGNRWWWCWYAYTYRNNTNTRHRIFPTSPLNRRILFNIKMIVIPLMVGALGTAFKNLEKRIGELEIRDRIKTVQTTALQRSAKILRRVLEKKGDLLSHRLCGNHHCENLAIFQFLVWFCFVFCGFCGVLFIFLFLNNHSISLGTDTSPMIIVNGTQEWYFDHM